MKNKFIKINFNENNLKKTLHYCVLPWPSHGKRILQERFCVNLNLREHDASKTKLKTKQGEY